MRRPTSGAGPRRALAPLLAFVLVAPTVCEIALAQRRPAPAPESDRVISDGGGRVELNAEEPAPLAPPSAGQLLITEFRFRGAAGANDEFIEIYNNTDAPVVVSDPTPPAAGTAGYAVAATNTAGAVAARCVIPAGVTIPARGHFLCTNNNASGGYSLGAYAAGDATYGSGVVDAGGVALFNTANSANFDAAHRLDAVGFQGITDPAALALFTEGTALAPSAGINVNGEHSFVRKVRLGGRVPQDTDDNQSDFEFVSTCNGAAGAPCAFAGRTAVLGAPGPENRNDPVGRYPARISDALLDPARPSSSPPNRERNTSAVPNGADGTLTIRRRFTNNTNATITCLRFRIVEITTLNSPVAVAPQTDLRALNSGAATVTVNGLPVSVEGTTVEATPAQPRGGGLNSALGRSAAAGTIVNTPIAPGETINVQFVFGVNGAPARFGVYVAVEVVP